MEPREASPVGGRASTLEVRRPLTPREVLDLFDDLPAVGLDDLAGAWAGTGVPTGHPLDGLLEASGWHGKRFDGPEAAHPLVMADARGRFAIDPAPLPLALLARRPGLASRRLVASGVARRGLRALATRRPAARLRTVTYRGVGTASMIYDRLPVVDHFRRLDADTLLGIMDARGVEGPLAFLLHREAGRT